MGRAGVGLRLRLDLGLGLGFARCFGEQGRVKVYFDDGWGFARAVTGVILVMWLLLS